jgi:hypothetical protein
MANSVKCANAACNCSIDKGGEWGKYCSEHCKQVGSKTELRCDCGHSTCR